MGEAGDPLPEPVLRAAAENLNFARLRIVLIHFAPGESPHQLRYRMEMERAHGTRTSCIVDEPGRGGRSHLRGLAGHTGKG